MNYYNENDSKCASWLRELIWAGLVPDGEVDERSIVDVLGTDLSGFRQCHFFAGIGGWSLALELASIDSSEPVWTGSCPCQPFSVGSVAHGGAQGQNDARHLWPYFFRLIRKWKPAIVFGEQVESAIKWGWLDRAALDFEGESYAFASAVLRADAVGAQHRRKRLYWVAHANGQRRQGHQPIKRLFVTKAQAQSVYGDPLAGARRALAGDYSDLLPCDGLSVQLERDALKGYGNAIVPPVAAKFIQASIESINNYGMHTTATD